MVFHFRKQTQTPSITDNLHKYTGTIVHLTHSDLDAAGSDAIVRMKYGNEILTFFSSTGKFKWFLGQFGNINGNGKTLIISDLSYQNEIETRIRKIHAAGWIICWYDHHKWTEDEKKRVLPYVSQLIIDTSRCATGVLAVSLHPEQPYAEEVARVVCDYDLWKHEDKRSSMLGIITSGNNILNLIRDKLYQGIIIDDEITAIYTKTIIMKNECISQSLKHVTVTDGKYRIAFMPCYGYPNETAAEIRTRHNTDMELLIFPTGRFTLRSKPPISHLIAKEFNGGGHPNASGGTFPFTFKDRLSFKLLHKVSYITEFIAISEKY